MTVAAWIARIDRLVWGPGMLALLMGIVLITIWPDLALAIPNFLYG